jgi:hypothetical protein
MVYRSIAISLILIVAFWLAFLVQNFVVFPLQAAIFPALTFPVVSFLHGVRVIAAWQFGWWSMALLAPNAGILALVLMAGYEATVVFEPTAFILLSLIFLASAPLSFSLLNWAYPVPADPGRFEWRRVIVAGILSATINVLAQTALFPPTVEVPQAILGMVLFLGTMVLGLFCTLLVLLLVLRDRGNPTRP